jgi:hypothetical protein
MVDSNKKIIYKDNLFSSTNNNALSKNKNKKHSYSACLRQVKYEKVK